MLNALWARALEDLAEMSRWLGNEGTARWADERREAVRDGFEQFWDDERDVYVDHLVDGVAQIQAAQHGGAAALAAGIVPAERIDRVVARLVDRSRSLRHSWVMDPVTPTGGSDGYHHLVLGYPEPTWDAETEMVEAEPFFRHVLHEGLARAGRADLIAELCRDWRVFLDAGETTWPECWTGGTRCHGWSSTPTWDLVTHTLGISPAAPGYASVRVDPHLGDLDWARAVVPTPHGPITVEARADGTVEIDSPVPWSEQRCPDGRDVVSADADGARVTETVPDAALMFDGRRQEGPTWEQLRTARDSGEVLWLDVERPGEDDLRTIATLFGFHDEMLRDSAEFDQRTRMADYEGYILIVMYAVAPDAVTMMEVHLYVTSQHVISIRREACPPITHLRDRVDHAVNATTTVPALLSRILSVLVGTFSDALERVDDDLTELESRILDDPLSKEQLDELLQVRRRVNLFRRAVDPARDLVGAGRFLVIDALEDVSDDARRHLRDLAVDLAHVGDQLEGERDRLSAVMDVYMNQVNNRQNRIMQQLAAVSTVSCRSRS